MLPQWRLCGCKVCYFWLPSKFWTRNSFGDIWKFRTSNYFKENRLMWMKYRQNDHDMIKVFAPAIIVEVFAHAPNNFRFLAVPPPILGFSTSCAPNAPQYFWYWGACPPNRDYLDPTLGPPGRTLEGDISPSNPILVGAVWWGRSQMVLGRAQKFSQRFRHRKNNPIYLIVLILLHFWEQIFKKSAILTCFCGVFGAAYLTLLTYSYGFYYISKNKFYNR